MNILITGITGFVGSHLADYILKQEPTAKIFGIKRWRSPMDNIRQLVDKVIFIEADLMDVFSLRRALLISKPDFVFHLASQSFPRTSFDSPIKTLNTNIIGTTNLLEEIRCLKDDGIIDPVIHSCSSSEVYGQPNEDEVPIKETNLLRAKNPYSISKVGHDLMSQYYFEAYGLKVMITRMFTHTGARRGEVFVLSSFCKQVAELELKESKEDLVINVGNLDSVRTWSHIDDAVRAYWLLVHNGKYGEIYNIGGTETTTVKEALDRIVERSNLSKEKVKYVVDPDRLRPTDITLQIPDTSKFREETGWEPEKNLNNIIDDLLVYWREQLKKFNS